jgi:hydrogenase maturation protein HypF
MLPYTPLHHLLLAEIDRPVVCTSGNLAEEPMAVDNAEALGRLGPIADVLLVHDRPIRRPVDDSVARVGPTGLQLLRRARGYAPLPLRLAGRWPTILALGGHLKNTIALSLGGASVRGQVRAAADAQTSVVLSAHIGDLDNVRAIEVFERNVQDMLAFFQTQPEVVACDLHPDYASTRYAEWLAGRWGAPLVRVQHHHAHAAACMAEHGLKGPTLALTWDGTGYGLDGTIWGGEALRCVDGDFQRFARLRTFTLPGGDRAVREPRRSALGVLYAVLGEEAARYAASWFLPAELDALLGLLRRGVHCPTTSSLGRLFDAVAALCGLGTQSSFEGQAAMALEFTAAEYERGAYPLPLCREAPDQPVPSPPPATPPPSIGSSQAGGNMSPLSDKWAAPPPSPSPLVADWEPTLRAVLADLAQGVPVARISARFHNALVEMALAVARAGECRQVVLSGGCFQNALLSERIYHRLRQEGFEAYCHREVPPGDGGIALGQVLVAALRYTKGHGTP